MEKKTEIETALKILQIYNIKDATTEEIKKQYKKLRRLYHPDVNNNNPAFTRLFIDTKKSYDILMNNKYWISTYNKKTSEKPKNDNYYKNECEECQEKIKYSPVKYQNQSLCTNCFKNSWKINQQNNNNDDKWKRVEDILKKQKNVNVNVTQTQNNRQNIKQRKRGMGWKGWAVIGGVIIIIIIISSILGTTGSNSNPYDQTLIYFWLY